VLVGRGDGVADLSGHLGRDRVQSVRSVQGDVGAVLTDLVVDRVATECHGPPSSPAVIPHTLTQSVQTVNEWGVWCPCRSEEHTSELQSRFDLVCRLLLE